MRRLVLIGASIALLVVGALPASGGHWRSEPRLYHADDRDGRVTFHQCELTTRFQNAFSSNNTHDIIPTNILVSGFNGCDTDDVRMNDFNFDQTTYFGWWECHSLVTSDMCDTGHVHIDLNERNYSDGDALSLTCEEIAHSVGLGHRTNATTDTCMKQLWSTKHLDQHDKDVINGHY